MKCPSLRVVRVEAVPLEEADVIGVERLPPLARGAEQLREHVEAVRIGLDAFDFAHGVRGDGTHRTGKSQGIGSGFRRRFFPDRLYRVYPKTTSVVLSEDCVRCGGMRRESLPVVTPNRQSGRRRGARFPGVLSHSPATSLGDDNMAFTGQTIENPVSGERITFLQTSADTVGEPAVGRDGALGPGRARAGRARSHPEAGGALPRARWD